MISFFEEYFFIIIVISIISELLISTSWSKFYFTYIFKFPMKIIALNDQQIEILHSSNDYEFKKDMQPTILMKKLSSNQLALREKFFEFSAITYSAIIHGCIQIDPKSKELKVYGVLNYTMILLVIFIGALIWDSTDIVFTLVVMIFPIILFTAILLAQRILYLEAFNNLLER